MVKKNDENLPEVRSDNLPAFIHPGSNRGKEHIQKTDLILPRLKLLQPLSPEVTVGTERPGTIVNSITGKNYGSELKFIVITHFKSRIFWKDREEGGGIVCAALNAVNPRTLTGKIETKEIHVDMPESCTFCSFKDWNNDQSAIEDRSPKCTVYYNFPIIIEGEESPAVLSMERTKIKAARRLLSLAAYSGGNYDIFARKYRLIVTKEKKNELVWFSYDVKAEGFVNQEEYAQAEKVYESLKNVIVQVDVEKPEE